MFDVTTEGSCHKWIYKLSIINENIKERKRITKQTVQT